MLDDGDIPEAEMECVLEEDNDALIVATQVGHALIYHEGNLSADRHADAVAHTRALTAQGLYFLKLATLTQTRDGPNRYIYALVPRRKIGRADCVKARALARHRYVPIPKPLRADAREFAR